MTKQQKRWFILGEQPEWWTGTIVAGLGALLLIWLFSDCSHMTVAPKPVNAHVIAFDQNTQNAGIIDCDHSGCIVTANFIAKYRQMEAKYKVTFPDDQYIKPIGFNYLIPYDCVENFTTMKAAERE